MAKRKEKMPKLKQAGALARELFAKADPAAVRRFLDCWEAAQIAVQFPQHFEASGLGVTVYEAEVPKPAAPTGGTT